MIFLFLSALFSILIANYLKYIREKVEGNQLSLFLGNYFLASVFGYYGSRHSLVFISSSLLIPAILMGSMYLFCLYLYNKNIRINGVSLSVTAMRISLVLPTILSILFFSEKINPSIVIGCLIILTSMFLMTQSHRQIHIIPLILLFFMTGLSDFIPKIADFIGNDNPSGFLMIVFLTAFLINIFLMIIRKTKLSIKAMTYGLCLGIPNYLTSFFFLLSLDKLPAVIAYPLNSSLIIFGSVLSDVLFWKYKPNRKQIVIYASLIIGMIILNFGIKR